MNSTPWGGSLSACLVLLFVTLPGFSAAAAPRFAVPPVGLALALENSPVEKHFEPAGGTVPGTGWGSVLLWSAGGFLAGFAVLILLRRLRESSRKRSRALFWAVPLVLAAGLSRAGACINVEDSTLEGTYLDVTDTGWFTGTVRNAMPAGPATESHLPPNPAPYSFPPGPGVLECDEAARLIIRGDAAGALRRLEEIESQYPGLYQTAANMGTAYELTGDDEKALHWIRTGIRRNPYSHMKAEWLHVKILEAKIALKKDPHWLESHTITGMDPREETGVYDTLQGPKSRRDILESMRSQATVRALFIKPLDTILAHLLNEAAVFALYADAGSAAGLVDLAESYGLPAGAVADTRRRVDRWIGAMPRPQFRTVAAVWLRQHWHWVVFGGFAAGGFWAGSVWKRRQRV